MTKIRKQFTGADFRRLLNQPFKIYYRSARLYDAELETAIELVEVKDFPEKGASPSGRPPFSIFFRCHGELSLPQGTYKIEHPEIGELHLFLVPLAPPEHGSLYEAVFN